MNEKEYDHALVLKAVKFAAESHYGAIRKGSKRNPIPYIVHPMEAAAIVASMTNDPNVIAAALLHDVVEDAKVSVKTIESEFNEIVAKLVAAESEDKREDLPSSETWHIRKWETIEHLKNLSPMGADKKFPAYVKILTLADKLSNIRAMKVDYVKHGDGLWERFNQKDPEMQAWYYRSLKEALDELQDYEAWKEYDRLVEEVFCEYKGYIYPMIDRSKVDFSDPDDKNIGYAEGILSDGRPYRMECWATNHSTYLTFFVSSIGIEHYSSDQVESYIEKEGLFWRLKKGLSGEAVLLIDPNENKFWSITLLVGDEDTTYIDSIPLKKWEYC